MDTISLLKITKGLILSKNVNGDTVLLLCSFSNDAFYLNKVSYNVKVKHVQMTPFPCYNLQRGIIPYKMYAELQFLFSAFCLMLNVLTLKAPITTAADDIHIYKEIFFHRFSEKIRLDASSESSAKQKIHMIYQGLFSSKDKSKKLKCRLLQFLFGALKVNHVS